MQSINSWQTLEEKQESFEGGVATELVVLAVYVNYDILCSFSLRSKAPACPYYF